MNIAQIFLLLVNVFLLTAIGSYFWVKRMRQIRFLWEDMNKYNHPKNVAASGGVVVVLIFIFGIFLYTSLEIFFNKFSSHSLEILAIVSTILFLAIVGIIDDFLGWKKGGLSIKLRLFLAILGAIPLIIISMEKSSINLPFFGLTNVGLLYPLFFVPLGIVGAATTYNFLAGYNGLESSQGIIILTFLSYVAYVTGSSWLLVIGLTMVSSLLGFYIFNKNPAKVFPGDSLTWSIGALIGGMSIIGNFEKLAAFVFTPYIIETVLKLKGKLKKHSFGKPNKDGSLEMPYDKIYGLEHLAIKMLKSIKPSRKAYEKEVVYLINAFQIIIIIIGFVIFL